MAVELNHTIVYCKDSHLSSRYYADMFGLDDPFPFSIFQCVSLANGLSLDFHDIEGEVPGQHYAFLVTEDEFDAIFGRIQERGITYYADPMLQQEGEINHHDGGRGVYWFDPDRHFLEIITRPYGSGAG